MNENRPFVIGISGKIGSGKTALSQALSDHLNVRQSSFGAAVREEAKSRGLDASDRKVLQEVGQQLVDGDVRLFCQKVLDLASFDKTTPVIIDGVRHINVKETLASLVSPLPFYLLYIETEEETRQARLSTRGGLPDSSQEHQTERDVFYGLRQAADLIIRNDGSIKHCVEIIEAWLEDRH